MHPYFAAYLAVLFFLLTPGVLLRLPAGGSRLVKAVTHGFVFLVALYLTKNVVLRLMYEGFQDAPQQAIASPPEMPAVEAQPNAPMPQMAEQVQKPAMPEGGKQTLVDFSGINLSIVNAGASPPGSDCSAGTQCSRGICINNRCL